MAGLLLHYLVLENVANIRHKHIEAYCDNTPTVSWATKYTSKQSRTRGRLVRAITLQNIFHVCPCSLRFLLQEKTINGKIWHPPYFKKRAILDFIHLMMFSYSVLIKCFYLHRQAVIMSKQRPHPSNKACNMLLERYPNTQYCIPQP